MTLVQLGHRGPVSGHVDDLHNGLYLLPDPGLVVAVETRLGPTRWRCGIVAARSGGQRGHIDVTAADLAAAHRSVAVDPDADPETFVLIWQASICRRWQSGHMLDVGRVLAESVRAPGTTYVDIDTAAARQIAWAARLRTPALHPLLGRLVAAHLLTTYVPAPGYLGTYAVTLPESADPSTLLSVDQVRTIDGDPS